MTLVKICGISEVADARAAAALGADFVGVVFAPSRRQVTIGEAKRISRGLGRARACLSSGATAEQIEQSLKAARPLLVGVFADQDADTINDVAVECGLDLVQLSGSEPWEMCSLIQRPVLKCLKVRPTDAAAGIMALAGEGAVILLDPHVSGIYGGTGTTLDWGVAAAVARVRRTVLAGGLTAENVAGAVEIVRPWAVDVSSGVETDGAKDVKKIRQFIQAAKATTGV